jgi:Leucine-rich repeat (LRR) protein
MGVPVANDVVFFMTPTTVTNIPTQTISALNIVAGNDVYFLAPTATILTISGNLDIQGRLHLGDFPAGTNSRITLVTPSANVATTGRLFVGDNAAVRVSMNFTLNSGGGLFTSRADGINGTSELTGAIQVTNGASANYGGNVDIGFTGAATQNANLTTVGGSKLPPIAVIRSKETAITNAMGNKNAVSNIDTLTINKSGGTAAMPQVVNLNIGANGTVNVANGIVFTPAGSYITLNIDDGTTLALNGGTTDLNVGNKIRVQGTVNHGMGATVNVNPGGEIEMNGTASWTSCCGATPNYTIGSILRYTGAGDKTTTNELLSSMNADVYVQKSSGTLTQDIITVTMLGKIFVSSPMSIDGGASQLFLQNTGNQVLSGGSITMIADGRLRLLNTSKLDVFNNGKVSVQTGYLDINPNTITIQSGGVLERANDVTGIFTAFGGAVVQYLSGSTLRYFGAGTVTVAAPSMELPLSMLGSVDVSNVGATTITSSSPLTIAGALTIGTANTTTLTGTSSVGGALQLFGALQLPNNFSTALNGALNLVGAFSIPNNPMTSLTIGGSGAVSGSFKVQGNTFGAGSLTLNRAGMTLPLGSPLIMGGSTTLFLQRGIIRTDANNQVILTNTNTMSPTALGQENPNSYIDGPMQRYLPANTTFAQGWRFPVGKNGRYMPFTLSGFQTGGNAPNIQAEVFTTAPPNTARDTSVASLSSTEYWRVDLLSGTFISGQAALERSQTIAANSVVAKAPSTGGVFASIGRTNIFPADPANGLFNNVIVSSTFTSFSLFTFATPTVPPPPVIPPALQAVITSFSPTIGTSGTSVIVTGANFTMVQAASIGGISVPFVVESPVRMRLGPIGLARTGAITLQTAMNGTATSSAMFTFVPAPTITSVIPSRSGIGQTLTVNGTNFVPTPREGGLPAILPQVNIGEVGANSVQVVSPTQMLVSFPSVTSASLLVQAWGGAATTSTVEILPPPVIFGVSPTQLAPGFLVTVTGANFTYASAVSVAGIPALSFTVNSPNRITVVVPFGARGGVSVTTPGGTVTNATVVNVIPPPTITSISPATAGVGTQITITGTSYIGVSNVVIGGIRASFSVDSSTTRITAIIPPNGATFASFATVSVTAVGGTITATQRILTVPPEGPVLTSFQPNPAVLGGTLRLTGVNLPTNIPANPPQNLISLSINGVNTPIESVTNGVITLTLPANVLPSSLNFTNASVTLTTQQGSTTASFLIPIGAPNAPALTGFSPTIGNANTTLVITGRNLDLAPRGTILGVSIGGVPVRSYMVVSTTQIVAMLANFSPTATSGTLAVTTPSGVLTLAQTFRFDPNYVPPVSVPRNDSLALVALYNATGGAGWANRTNWLQDYVSTWYGVKVEGGRVVEVRLPQNGLSGQIGTSLTGMLPELANLDALRVLDVSSNSLAGVLPASLASMRSLEVLNISNNIIVGEITQFLCGLQRIKELNIANNRIQGELGSLLCCFPRIEKFNAQNNDIAGKIPFCVKDLQSLTVLDLRDNRLSDTLPVWLGDAPVLAELRLGGNLLRGKLPAAWGTQAGKRLASGLTNNFAIFNTKQSAQTQALEGLTVLDVSRNQLSGAIPLEWGGFTSLRELDLSDNALKGAVPPELANLRRLRKLVLSQNRITALPDLGSSIRNLDTLLVENNALDFASLEPNALIRTFRYAPQSEVGSPSTTTATIDALFSQRFLTGGANNRYEWRKTSVDEPLRVFPITNDGIMRIPAFAPADTGVYRCFITNPLAPSLTLTSATVRVSSTNPNALPNAPILISPARGEGDIALRPVLSWVPSVGASSYDIELSTNATFTPVNVRDRVAQTLDGIVNMRLEALAPLLEAETRYYWRVRAVNTLGASAWTDVRDPQRDFRTVSAAVAVSVERVNFGDVPRLDTAQAVMRLTNVTNQPLVLQQITFALPAFALPAFATSRNVQNITLTPGQVLMLPVDFRPQTLGAISSSVTVAYTLAGTRSERSFEARLLGVGAALKVVPPDFETVIVNRPRIASGLIINRGDREAVVRKIEITSARLIYEYLPNTDSLIIGVGDTATAVFRCRPRTSGTVERGTVRYEANVDTAETPLNANARFLRPGEAVARVGVRMVPPSAPPGAAVVMELYLESSPDNPLTQAQRDELYLQITPTVRAVVNYSHQVLLLSNTNANTIARRIRNTAPRNRIERIEVPFAGTWDRRTNTLAQIPCVAVAGDIDVTKLFVEDIDWQNVAVELDTVRFGTFRAEACEAGGKRLVTTAKAQSITALAPNPAKDVLTIAYTVREDSFVEIALVNMLGSVIVTAVAKEQAAGEYVLTLPVQNVPQGAYLLRFATPNAVLTRRVEVVR